MDEDSLTFDSRTDASLVERLLGWVRSTRRRRRAALLLLAAVVAAGAALATGALAGVDDRRLPVDRVPSGADAVVVADASAADAPTTRRLVDGVTTRLNASGRYAGPTQYRGLVERAEAETGAPLGAVDAAVGFVRYPENGSEPDTALIVVAAWDTQTAVAAIERGVNRSPQQNASFVRDETAVGTVYRPTTNLSLRIGVLDGGYVIGTPHAVRDALAVNRGDRAALGGPLRTAYDGTAEGGIRYAARVPSGSLSAQSGRFGEDTVPDLERVSGAAVASNGTVAVTARLHASTADDADDLEDLIRARDVLLESTDPEVNAALDNLTVEHADTRVTVTYAVPADTASAHAVGVVDRAAVRRLARIARRS